MLLWKGRKQAKWIALDIVLASSLTLFILIVFFPAFDPFRGLWVPVGLGHTPFSMNHVRLRTPSDEPWSEMVLSYQLEAHDAISFVVDRKGDNFVVFRLSVRPELPSAFLRFKAGGVVERQTIDTAFVPSKGRVRFLREDETISMAIDGQLIASHSNQRMSSSFELVSLPPGRLIHRIEVDKVALADGRILCEERPYDLFLPSVVFVIAIVFWSACLYAGVRLMGAVHQRPRFEPRLPCIKQAAVVLLCLNLGLGVAVYYLYKYGGIHNVIHKEIVIIIGGWIFASLFLFFFNAGLSSRRGHFKVSHHPLFGFVFPFLSAPAVLCVYYVVFLLFLDPVDRWRPIDDLATRSPRILLYGGSSTAGYPYDKTSPKIYPRMLEAKLRAHISSRPIVLNFGSNGKSIDDILTDLPKDLVTYNPTHIVINSMQNNLDLDYEPVFERIVKLIAPQVKEVFLVLEPSFQVVYNQRPWQKLESRESKQYAAIERIAEQHGVRVIDPMPVFRHYRDAFLFIDSSVHLTELGNRLLTEVLEKEIISPKTRDDA